METPNQQSEADLLQHAKSLASNGHRFSYIYKYLRARTDDAEMISRIIDQVKADTNVEDQRKEQLKKLDKKKFSTVNVVMGMVIMILGAVINQVLAADGFVGTLPYILIFAGLGIGVREFIR